MFCFLLLIQLLLGLSRRDLDQDIVELLLVILTSSINILVLDYILVLDCILLLDCILVLDYILRLDHVLLLQ